MTEPLRPQSDQMIEVPDVLTVLPLKDAVIFPYLILPLSIADEETMQTVDRALTDGRVLLLTAQRSPDVDRPGPDDLYQVGTAATIMRLLKLPDGRVRILVQGLCRARLEHVSRSEPFLMARISKLDDLTLEELDVTPLELEARVRSVREGLERAAALGRGISPEVLGVSADVTSV